jgi:hypothetical protein
MEIKISIKDSIIPDNAYKVNNFDDAQTILDAFYRAYKKAEQEELQDDHIMGEILSSQKPDPEREITHPDAN